MSKAMLIDTTRCIGCRACQVACKSWHDLPGERTTFSETWSNPRYMDSNNYTRIIFREVAQPEGKLQLAFYQAPVHALPGPGLRQRLPGGGADQTAKAVRWSMTTTSCIGCRYCMMACPFQVPKFEWGSAVPLIRKCDFCADRHRHRPGAGLRHHLPHRRPALRGPGRPPEGGAPPHRRPPGKVLPRGVRRKDRGRHRQALPHRRCPLRPWGLTTGASAPTWGTCPTASTAGSGCPRCPLWPWAWAAWPWASTISTSAGRKCRTRNLRKARRTEPWPKKWKNGIREKAS